ncbi:hypothetical protein HHI36_014250 [Cryptolaemus montrouzieri]|uniref:Fatty acyl-CoA reductase n=1 Tax=Cryptolaemus montrouzieri TaxID=559131 RepID=A0ABD2N1Z4_9CUCU
MTPSSWIAHPSKGYETVNELCVNNEDTIDLNSFKEIDECVHISSEGSKVVEFYNGKSVLITGGLGFMGKLIIEKLLRTCKNIATIYLIVRPKRQKDAATRVEEAFNDILFSELKKVHPEFKKKIVAIEGDLSLPGIGITEENRRIINDNVNIIIHGAASVKLNEDISSSITTNLLGTIEILKVVKSCKSLSSFVYVSTVYSNSMHREIEEKVYFTPYSADEILKLVKDEGKKLDSKSEWIIGRWPNSYSFSKAISENTVIKECSGLPVCIFRPAIITATHREPVKGWINNYYGAVGVIALNQKGLVRCLHINPDNFLEIVPGDFVANAIIVAAYNNQFHTSTSMKIYNFVSSPQNPISKRDLLTLAQYYGYQVATFQTIWYPFYILIENIYVYVVCSFLLHNVPAALQDVLLVLSGKKPKLLSTYKNIHKFTKSLDFVTTKDFQIQNNNVQKLWDSLSIIDQRIFNFNMSKTNINWNEYIKRLCAGIKFYLYKEEFDTIPKARNHLKKLEFYHLVSQLIFIFVILLFCYWIYSLF